MQIRNIADPEMVKRIIASVQTPELQSLLLQIVQDQRITQNARDRLKAYLEGKRPTKTGSRILEWMRDAFN
jgi:predicted transcriptional regulator